ncbi:hypothetical protein EG829_03010 [bacterium]|nr:hypothetical protein [bacterium]
MSKIWVTLLMLCLAVGCSGMGNSAGRGEAPRMSKEELKTLLGSPDLVLIDVRYGKDWSDTDRKITGAVRGEPKQFDLWREKYPKTKTLVLYCA